MTIRPWHLLVTVVLGLLQACGTDPTPSRWYYTCGDPVCRAWEPHPGVAACSAEAAGASCAAVGAQCDPHDACNRLLVCATRDPRPDVGCPISHAADKRDIRYLTAADLDRRHDELRALRLAVYRYREDGPRAPERLGFVIDDRPPDVCVRGDGETVDLYGYASLTVAAVQAQARRVETLEREVAALRAEVARLRPAAAARPQRPAAR